MFIIRILIKFSMARIKSLWIVHTNTEMGGVRLDLHEQRKHDERERQTAAHTENFALINKLALRSAGKSNFRQTQPFWDYIIPYLN